MQPYTIQLIQELAFLLKNKSYKILDGDSWLNLSSHTLYCINQAYNIITREDIIPDEFYTKEFANNILYIVDTFYFVPCVKISRDIFHQIPIKVDLSLFKNIKELEINYIPLYLFLNSQHISLKLHTLALNTCIPYKNDLFDLHNLLGAQAPVLKKFILRHDKISQLFANSNLTVHCWFKQLQHLDLSNQNIEEINSTIKVMPKLKYLNIGYNRFINIPIFSSEGKLNMKTLIIKNNKLESILGVENLVNLTHFDVSNNVLCSHKCLTPLKSLSKLASLKIRGNPLSLHPFNRQLTAAYVNQNALIRSRTPFVLENHPLTRDQLLSYFAETVAPLKASKSLECLRNALISLTTAPSQRLNDHEASIIVIPNVSNSTWFVPKPSFIPNVNHLLDRQQLDDLLISEGLSVDFRHIREPTIIADIPLNLSDQIPRGSRNLLLLNLTNESAIQSFMVQESAGDGEWSIIDKHFKAANLNLQLSPNFSVPANDGIPQDTLLKNLLEISDDKNLNGKENSLSRSETPLRYKSGKNKPGNRRHKRQISFDSRSITSSSVLEEPVASSFKEGLSSAMSKPSFFHDDSLSLLRFLSTKNNEGVSTPFKTDEEENGTKNFEEDSTATLKTQFKSEAAIDSLINSTAKVNERDFTELFLEESENSINDETNIVDNNVEDTQNTSKTSYLSLKDGSEKGDMYEEDEDDFDEISETTPSSSLSDTQCVVSGGDTTIISLSSKICSTPLARRPITTFLQCLKCSHKWESPSQYITNNPYKLLTSEFNTKKNSNLKYLNSPGISSSYLDHFNQIGSTESQICCPKCKGTFIIENQGEELNTSQNNLQFPQITATAKLNKMFSFKSFNMPSPLAIPGSSMGKKSDMPYNYSNKDREMVDSSATVESKNSRSSSITSLESAQSASNFESLN